MSLLVSARDILNQTGVGASMIPAISGISPWSNKWREWAIAQGLVERPPESSRMFWGRKLQRGIAEGFSEIFGIPHEWSDRSFYHAERPWQRATVDAFIPTIAEPEAVLEIKTAGLDQAAEFGRVEEGELGDEADIPEHYLAQLNWQMDVHGLKVAYLAVLISGNDFRCYRAVYDEALAAILREDGWEFWSQNVMGGIEPEIEPSDEADQYLKRRYPRDVEKIRLARDGEIQLLDELSYVRLALGPLEKRKAELEIQLKQAVGDAAGIESARAKFTWKKFRDSQEVNWQKLAESQLTGYADDIRHSMIAEVTETKPGTRRVHFTDRRSDA